MLKINSSTTGGGWIQMELIVITNSDIMQLMIIFDYIVEIVVICCSRIDAANTSAGIALYFSFQEASSPVKKHSSYQKFIQVVVISLLWSKWAHSLPNCPSLCGKLALFPLKNRMI